jgi:hypothetical protein
MSKQSGQISSPEATGEAGIFFEQHVNATFLAFCSFEASRRS